VGRPERPPCGDRTALSGSCAALRGHRPDSARTATGSVRPARRFDALRALAGPGLPSRLASDGGPPCAFALLQRSIAAPPHRPEDPKALMADDASSPGLSCRTTHPERRTRVDAGLPAPLRATSRVWVPPSRLPPSSLPTPCGAGASLGFTLQGLLLATIGTPSGAPCPLGVPRVDSPRPHGERADAAAYRASIPSRARSADRIPKDPARRCLPGLRPSRAFSLLGLRLRFVSRGIPSHALGGMTSQPACVTRSSGSGRSAVPSRGCRLSWAFSPSDRHGTAGVGAGGGLMDLPHGSRALQAARTDLSPLASPTRPRLSPRPGAAVHR
jgi:hypothetical protein